MRYAFHDLHPNQFEDLVVEVCHELLGAGVQKFATGPDEGRDAKFEGTASAFPSSSDPLTGKTIIQAKHTIDAIGKFSDSDFSGDGDSSTISEEIPRIINLQCDGHIDNYLLFANRRLGAIINEDIVARIIKETDVPVVHLFGIEQIERYVKRYPYLSTMISDFEYDLPLRASPDDLAEVIVAIDKIQHELEWPKSRKIAAIERTAFKKKNELNGLSDDYALYITRNYLKHFSVIKKFLADPLNVNVYSSYCDAVEEFEGKLSAHRNDFDTFDKILDHLISLLIERDGDLRSNKRLTRIVFYFMFWNCDIGTTEEEVLAETD